MATKAVQKILVVGGNGFIGSAVCRAALAKGMDVTSISVSGRAFTTPKGHSPAWTSKVKWLKGDALQPSTFSHLLPEIDGVVHTIGTLLEGAKYKQALRDGDLGSLLQQIVGNGNPLEQLADNTSYNALNRDSALRVCEAFVASGEGMPYSSPRPFVYISAEDIYRPIIPAGYINSKREAERGIADILSSKPTEYRGVYIRPSLVYHSHFRPLTPLFATLLEFSASMHAKAPTGAPTPSNMIRSIGSAFGNNTALESIANALKIPPIHVDHVGTSVAIALEAESRVEGVVGVQEMRELLGWPSHTKPSIAIDRT